MLVEAGGQLLSEPGRWQRLVARLRPGKLGSVMGERRAGARAAVVVCFDCEIFTRGGAATR